MRGTIQSGAQLQLLRSECDADGIRERTQWISQLSKKGREDAAPELARLDVRRDELDALIAQRQAEHRPLREPVDRVIDRAMARCQRLAAEIGTLPGPTMREIAATFFTRVEGDMETKNVEVSIALPTFVLEARKNPAGEKEVDQHDLVAMCVGRSFRSSVSSDTQHRIALAAALCKYQRGQRDVCYQCRRIAA